jgi:GDPmannose 4,6-dehydratase
MKALIIGVGGQDGSYLAELLLNKNYNVTGTSRNVEYNKFDNLKILDIFNDIELISLDIKNQKSIEKTLQEQKPDEIYNLSGQTSVGASFEDRIETYESIFLGTLNILEAIKKINQNIKFFNAGSGEIFGGNNENISNEISVISPMSPYGAAKASSLYLVDSYRKSFNIFCSTGITFNHESPLRPEHFVTKKIVKTAFDISSGTKEKLSLGNINIKRDWGWAPEYVSAMHLILQQDISDNFIISTGKVTSLKNFIDITFSFFNLDYKDFLEIDPNFIRKTDIEINGGNPNKIYNEIGWKSNFEIEDIVNEMCKNIQN